MTNEKLEQLDQLLFEFTIHCVEQQITRQVGNFIIQPIYGHYCDEENEYIVDTECMSDEFESAIECINTELAFN